MGIKTGFALSYPPDFDGELHIDMEESLPDTCGIVRTLTIRVRCDQEEKMTQTIRRVGQEMLHQPIKGRFVR